MSTTRSLISHSLTNLQNKPSFKSQPLIFNPTCCLANSNHKNRSWPMSNGGLRLSDSHSKRGIVVFSSVEPGAPLPSDPSPSSWKSWILGALITIILPFLRNKWGPLFKISKEVEAAVEKAEHVTEVLEKVAEEVEKVAEDVADELPEGAKLRVAIEYVEDAAKEAAKDAHLVEEIFVKVEEVDKEVESFMEPVKDQPSGAAKQATTQ